MSYESDCTWPPLIRWISFIPLGLIAAGLISGLVNWANPDTPRIALILAIAIEPWIFLMVSLWILPKYYNLFLIIFLIIYIILHLSIIYMFAINSDHIPQIWIDYLTHIIALISGFLSYLYFKN